MSYIDKIKVDGSLYSAYDDRLPFPEVTDEGKVITVDASGNYELETIDAYTKTETDAKLALKANASSVYTKSQVDTALGNKQDTLTAGANIDITNDVISVTGNLGAAVVDLGTVEGDPVSEPIEVEITSDQYQTVINTTDVIVKFSAGDDMPFETRKVTQFTDGGETKALCTSVFSMESDIIVTIMVESSLATISAKEVSGGGSGDGIPQLASEAEAEAFAKADNLGKLAQYTGVDYKASSAFNYADRFTVSVNEATFKSEISDAGDYEFEYDGSSWDPSIATYGITVSGSPIEGDKIIVTYQGNGAIEVGDHITGLYWTTDTANVDFTTLFEEGQTYPATEGAIVQVNTGYAPDSINASVFGTAVGHSDGYYQFTYDGHDTNSWTYNSEPVDLADYGMVFSHTPEDGWSFNIEYFYIADTIAILEGTGHSEEYYNEDGSDIGMKFVADINGNLYIIFNFNQRNGTTMDGMSDYHDMFVAGEGWDMYGTQWLFQYKVKTLDVDSLTGVSTWDDWISKVPFPAISTSTEYAARLEADIDQDTYVSGGAQKGSSESFIYHNNQWCTRAVAEGTPVDSETGTSPMTVYYNTLLSADEVGALCAAAGIPAAGGSGGNETIFGVPASGASYGYDEEWRALGYANQYALMSSASSAPSGFIENGIDMVSQYLQIPKGWIESSAEVDTTEFKVEDDFRELVDALFSLTPFGYVYTPVSLANKGITVEGTPIEGDILTVSLVDNGYQKYELYRVESEPAKEYVEVGDTVSTIYFNTMYTPKATELSGLFGEMLFGIYCDSAWPYSEGLMAYPLAKIGISEDPDDILICTQLDFNSGMPVASSVVYSSVAVPELGVAAGWSKSSCTFTAPFVVVDSVNMGGSGGSVSFADNIEAAKNFVKSIPWGVQPEDKYYLYKFYQSPGESSGSGITVIDFGTITDLQTMFAPTKEQIDTIKNSNGAVLGKVTMMDMNLYAPLTVAGYSGDWESDLYSFTSKCTINDGSEGQAELQIIIIPDYDGMAIGMIMIAPGGSGSSGVTDINGYTGSISVGNGITMNGNQIENSGVTSIGNQTGSISVGNGLSMSGTTIGIDGTTMTVVRDIGGAGGSITLGSGLSMSGNELSASASIPTYSPITMYNNGVQGQNYFEAQSSADSQIIADGKLYKVELDNVTCAITANGSRSGVIIVGDNSYVPTYGIVKGFDSSSSTYVYDYIEITKDTSYAMAAFVIPGFFTGEHITVTRLI